MKIAITGGAGFVGSHIAEELSKEKDNEVVILDDLSAGKTENIKSLDVKFVKGSVTDLDLLEKVFKNCGCVFHQAAICSVSESIKDPIASNNVNVNGTLNVLLAAKECGVEKVVCASSSSVYGDTSELPKREDMLPTPLSPYAATKLVGEHYCKVFNEIYGLKTVSLRYFNVYGPRQDPVSEYAAVIPRFIACVRNNQSLVIHRDGTQTRDFVFVKDVVKANILAMKSNATGVFNIGSGRETSINELAKLITDSLCKNLKVVYEEARKGDVKRSLADISKAKDKLGYEPTYRLEEGLKLYAAEGRFAEWKE